MTLPQQPFGNLAYLQRFWVQEDPYFDQVPILAGLGRKAESWSEEAAAAPAPAVDESPEPAVSESPGEQNPAGAFILCFQVADTRLLSVLHGL